MSRTVTGPMASIEEDEERASCFEGGRWARSTPRDKRRYALAGSELLVEFVRQLLELELQCRPL